VSAVVDANYVTPNLHEVLNAEGAANARLIAAASTGECFSLN
jgi:hypothetical protein